jgi:hypothetical protein
MKYIYKNTKGEILFIILIAVTGIILAILALGLATGENRFLKTFIGGYGGDNSDDCGLVLESPQEDDLFIFPYTVVGKINGCGWTAHEGEIGWVEIIEGASILAVEPIVASTPWMTETVYFDQNLDFPLVSGNSAILRFHNTDASGENPLSVDIHVNLQ